MHPTMTFGHTGSRPAPAAAAASSDKNPMHSLHQSAGSCGVSYGSHNNKPSGGHARPGESGHALVPTAQQKAKAQQLHSDRGAPSAGTLQPLQSWPELLPPPTAFNSNMPQQLRHLAVDAGAGHEGWLPVVKPAGVKSRAAATSSKAASQLHQEAKSPGVNKAQKSVGSYAGLHQQQLGLVSPTSPGAAGSGGAFGQASSRYAESAAKYVKAHQAKAKQKQKQQGRQKLPDRFAEGAKSAAMIAAVASRW